MSNANDHELVTWTLSADRRKASRGQIVDELESLEASIKGLEVDLLAESSFEDAADGGAFRDFVALARLSHARKEALEYVAEELLEQFGWLVDFRPPEEPP